MAITPQTNIRLIKCPLTLDNKNQLTFANAEQQINYFKSLPYIEVENYTYQRKDNILRFGEHIDNIIEYNYCIYQNENYSNKWFFAYITNMSYVNDGLTNITLETDVFQTWQFDIIFKNSFVEREHVSNDTIGLHTIDENLNVGEVIEESESDDVTMMFTPYIAVQTAWQPLDNSTGTEIGDSNRGKQFDGIAVYNRQVFGTQVLLFPVNNLNSYKDLALYILRTNADGHIQDIENIFIVPGTLIDESTIIDHSASVGGEEFTFYTLPYSITAEEYTFDINKNLSFTNFIPKNNKIYCYPYNYLRVSNNIGNINNYRYEDFSNSTKATFKVALALSVGVSGKLIPLNYQGMTTADEESIPLPKFPTCGWSSDAFINWLTQQAVNEPLKIATSFENVTNPAELGTTVMNNIFNQIGNFYSGALMPNIEGGQNTGDINYALNKNTFTFRAMRAKTEYLKTIDEFFSMFGYKVNEVKIPNLTGRQNWNYIKTIDCNILGNIPQMDLQEIKNMFNTGVTLWHNPSTFLDYSQSNNII